MDINNIDKFCFFYKTSVPEIGDDFTYVKLGKKETLEQSENKKIIFEADYKDNIIAANPWLWDYTGLYLLYKNNLVSKKNILVLHYDAYPEDDWRKKLDSFSGELGVFGETKISEWLCYNKPVNILPFIEINDIFLSVFKVSYWSIIESMKIKKIAGFSQFVSTYQVWQEMMEFLIPLIDFVKNKQPSIAYYAHLLEICWGTFCARRNYELLDFCSNEVSSSHLYGQDINFKKKYMESYFNDIVKKKISVKEAYLKAEIDIDKLLKYTLYSENTPDENLSLL